MKQTICTPTSRWSVAPSTLGGHAFVDVILKHASGAVLGVTLSAAEAGLIAQAMDLAAEECAAQPDPRYLLGAGDNDTAPAGVTAPEKVAAAGAGMAWPAFPGEPVGNCMRAADGKRRRWA